MVLRRVLACVLLVMLLGLHASSLDAANPVPQSPVVTTSTQCFIATADSYTSNQDPDTNYGNDNRLRVASVGDVTVIRYEIYLDFALDAIPDDATVLSADLRLTALASPGGTVTYARAVASNWSESTITWNNDPTVGTFSYDTVVVDSAAGVKTWQVPELVNAWVNGSQTNHGLALVSGGVAAPIAEFYSTEGTLTQRPRLCVEWTEDDVTTDIVIDGIEVTQAVQNLDNDVDLVAGKRTFVRVHAHTTNGQFRTFATLTASYGASRATLHPQNPGAHAVLGPDPDRGVLYESFLFELPSTYTQEGSVYLQASVNSLEGWRPSRYPPETSYANNSMDATVTFETVPRIGLIVYRGTYTLDDNGTDVAYTPPFTDVYQTRSWLRRAYPISDIWMTIRTYDFGEGSLDPDKPSRLTQPNSGGVNSLLGDIRTSDLDNDSWYESFVGDESEIRYYAMIDNGGGFMRGAMGSRTGSGPTGPIGGWDSDGIFGDWYAGHEVGHSFGRSHVQGDPGGKPGECGGEAGVDGNYPYADGFISDATTGTQAYYGFDIGTRYQSYGLIPVDVTVYGPDWRDVMTYCAPQWISDYTYEGIMANIQANVTPVGSATTGAAFSAAGVEAPMDRLSVMGTIDPATQATDLRPLFVIPGAEDVDPRVSGDYAIVLGDATTELARYAFTPVEVHSGPPEPGGDSEPAVHTLVISEFVPYVSGTTRVDIEGPSGLLATVSAGAATPQVTVTSPNGGELLTGDTVPVSWTASDADGDDLVFNVDYSRDNGTTWQTVAHHVTGTSVEIPRDNFPSTSQGLLRIRVSDGIHTATDTSDGVFTMITRPPEIEILTPAPETFVAVNQTLSLSALGYSINSGTPLPEQISWSSSIDGDLGNGEELSVTGLTPGVHEITVLYNDGTALANDTVSDVVVVADPRELPVPPDEVAVAPTTLVFWPAEGITQQTVRVGNQAGSDSLSFGSLEFESWLSVDPVTGNTPDEVTVTVDATNLDPGIHDARIAFASVETSGTIFVDVVVNIPERALRVWLPSVLRGTGTNQ